MQFFLLLLFLELATKQVLFLYIFLSSDVTDIMLYLHLDYLTLRV